MKSSASHSARAARIILAAAALFAADSTALAADPAGKAMYQANCSACHRIDGKGVKGAFPPLAGNPLVVGPKPVPVSRILNGRGGMPAFKTELSDGQIAAILTYVRSSWGNGADPVKPAEVAAARRGPAPAPTRSLQAH